MALENTGKQAFRKLKKVVDGGPNDGQALDDNNYLVSVSGQPQSKKDNNLGDPDYAAPITNEGACTPGPV